MKPFGKQIRNCLVVILALIFAFGISAKRMETLFTGYETPANELGVGYRLNE